MSKFHVCELKQLTEEQQDKIQQLKQNILKWDDIEFTEEEEKLYINETTCHRLMHGWEWNIEHAEKCLKKSLLWKREFKPEKLRIKDLPHYHKMAIFNHGFDKQGHPVRYIILERDDLENNDEGFAEKLKMLVYTIEAAKRQMKEPITSITNIIDIKGIPTSLELAYRVKTLLDQISENYVERNHKMIVINASWTITWMWSGISLLVPKHVVEKYSFVGYDQQEILSTLLEWIDDDQLVIYNGKEHLYNEEEELKKEKEIFGD